MKKKDVHQANRSGCSVCFQTFPNEAERDLHAQSDHPTDASGAFYLPVERYQAKRAPASSGKASTPKRTTDTSWFDQNPIGQTRAKSKRTSIGPSDVEAVIATSSITTPETPATVLVDLHAVLPDQAGLDEPPSSSPPANNKKIKRLTCPICDALFSSKQYLKSHRKNSHPTIPIRPPGVDSTLCITCNRDFQTPNALELHLRNSTVHAVKHHCRFCSLHFFTPGALVVHGVIAHRLHLPCDSCSDWFATEEQRAEHVKAVHTKRVPGPGPARRQPGTSPTSGLWAGLFGGGGTTTEMGVRSHRYL